MKKKNILIGFNRSRREEGACYDLEKAFVGRKRV
jgi:hypothetical protein